MKAKATVISENSVFHLPGAIAEHGLSIYLETENGNYLFDTGQGKAIINNARVLKKDLTSIKGVILSHHHYDHTGGLLPVLEIKGQVDVFAHAQLFKESYNLKDNNYRYSGLPYNRIFLESKGARFLLNTDWLEIEPGMFLSGEIPRKTDFEEGDNKLHIKEGGSYIQDIVLDDQSLVITTEKGLFIVLGCAHSGIINILDYAVRKTGCAKICAVIGGTHLGPVSEIQRETTIKMLKEFDIDKIGVSHCTGLKAAVELGQQFKEKFFFCNVGTVVAS
ncbi:MAG: beta-lactamase [Clostridiaceae bacterium BRH_c20a]|nr:MAG: beta-lactamase [Clostridiaceae bacterium BRH_c20a]